MKFITHTSILCIFLLISCAQNNNSIQDLILTPEYQKINSIYSSAECTSPFGAYTTQVHSFQNGSCLFIQEFGNNERPFKVKIDTTNQGFILDSIGSIIDTLSLTNIEMIRGHEIHKMTSNPELFFKDIEWLSSIKIDNSSPTLFRAKDGLNNPVSIFYDDKQKRISKIELLNSRDTSETIEIFMDTWIETEFGDLVKEARFVQAQKDTFGFKFTSLIVTDTSHATFEVVHLMQ